jgi:hypothetical protein
MAEDQTDSEAVVVKGPLKGPEAARATRERLQKKGILPVREKPESDKIHTAPFVTETQPEEVYDPTKKLFPQAQGEEGKEIRAKIVESYGGKESVSAEAKKGLTEDARKLNTMAVSISESSETQEPVVTTPVSETPIPEATPIETPPATYQPQVEAKGGSAFLKKALKDNEPLESTRTIGVSTFKVPAEAEFLPPSQRPFQKRPPAQPTPFPKPPMPEEVIREQVKSTPQVEPKPPFWANLFNRIRGRS